jgi:amino acid adenylation domain-containing protein
VWAAVQMGDEASCAYNQCYSLQLRGPLSAELMESALRQVVNRHDALRVTIDADGECQKVAPASQMDLPVFDLSHLSLEAKAAEIERLLEIETTRPFDLASGPLLRAALVREAPDLHCLIVTVHHIVCDGWSSAVLFGDLARIYAADRHGPPAQLPVASSYRDYVAREAVRADDAQARADADYWAQQYADSIPVLDLPLDAPRPGIKTYSGARQELRLDESLCRALKAAGAKHGCTLFVTLLAGFEALLSRLSGQEDFVVGVPMAGQTLLENGDLVGHCVNLIPLRCRIEPAARFMDHLKSVRHAFLDAQSHQQVSFGGLVRKLNVPRDLSRTPLVSVTFNIDKLGTPFDFGELTLEAVETPKRFLNFEISINVVDSERDLIVECEYNTDLFAAATIGKWLGHYQVLLEAIASNCAQRVDELPLLTETGRHQAISGWNQAISYPKAACLHERFEQQVERTPKAVALVYEGQRLSYVELNRRANQLAHRLRELGVTPDQLVGLRIERGVEMVVGILGILKAGGAYLPLDPVYPKDRIAFMLEDSRVAVVVTQKSLAADLDGIRVTRVRLDEPLPGVDTNPAPVSTADSLAYVIYTSGSTGQPKGVLITHYNVTRLFEATDAWYHFDHQDVWTLFHSYAFDFSVWELWGALLYGGRLVVVPYLVSRSPEDLRELLISERVTVLNQTPSAFRQLIQADLSQPKADLALRYVIFGGEALELQSLRPWFERYGDEQPLLVNMYGITETTVHVTYRPIRQVDLQSGQGSVIGNPIPDLQVYILDPQGQPAPIGVPGEMYVGGAGVARGYLNRAELTAQRFIADPFALGNGARLYRTGDLARRHENGDIEYLGRIDQQVKIRGYRVELGEIEAVLAEHPGVRQVAVHLWQVEANDVRIVACCVPAKAGVLAPLSLRKHLQARLPEYMLPQYFIPVEEIPLTPNGKVDRRRLPTPVITESGIGQHETPADPVEAAIAEIWTQLIHPARPIGRNDRFFEMGGHSLLGLQALRQMENHFGVKLDFRVLFQESLAELATQCRSESRAVRQRRRGHWLHSACASIRRHAGLSTWFRSTS